MKIAVITLMKRDDGRFQCQVERPLAAPDFVADSHFTPEGALANAAFRLKQEMDRENEPVDTNWR